MLESAIDRVFTRLVRTELGGMVVKLAPTTVGVPDRMVILPGGRIRLVELKTENGRLSAKQTHWQNLAAQRGTTVDTLHGLGDVRLWIDRNRI